MPHLRRPHVAPRARSLTLQTAQRARRAKWELAALVPLFAITLGAYVERERIFGVDTPVRVAAAVVMVILGWALARDLGRFTAPALFRRMDPGTAGTAGFLLRLVFIVVAAVLALRVAGLNPGTLAVGGAVGAVVLGLAAQQTLGNVIAGIVLIGVRPFKVGDRVRLQAGGLAGQVEGVVSSLGLLYTTLAQGGDFVMVPNNVVLSAAVVPLREPASVDLRARLPPDVKPSDVQAMLDETINTRSAASPRSRSRRSTPKRSSSASKPPRSPTPTVLASPTRSSPPWARRRRRSKRAQRADRRGARPPGRLAPPRPR
jgi:small conductance mechanosensitive channel